jgi:ubiquinone/menaquinone biosynthesis C-methylase UbiE
MYKIKQLFYNDKQRLFFILLKNLVSDKRDLINYIAQNYYRSDDTIYKYISDNFEFSENNSAVRLDCLKNSNLIDLYKIKNIENTKYLDIGCHKGNLTKSIVEYFNILSENVYGIDIKKHESFTFDFKLFNGGEIPHPDNTFDIITCFMLLHHCQNYKKLIKEIHRVLKSGGILIIKEHDCIDKNDKLVLDILHEFYDIILYKDSNNWYAEYISENYMSGEIKDVGFELLTPVIIKNKKINPLRNYISLFIRK